MTKLLVLRRLAVAVTAAAAALGLLAAPASAHPLGNFTINHYAEVRVGERQIRLSSRVSSGNSRLPGNSLIPIW